MGEFKPASSADGSWAHPPEEEVAPGAMPPGPFQVTSMPAPQPAPPPPSPQTERLLRSVAPPDGDDE